MNFELCLGTKLLNFKVQKMASYILCAHKPYSYLLMPGHIVYILIFGNLKPSMQLVKASLCMHAHGLKADCSIASQLDSYLTKRSIHSGPFYILQLYACCVGSSVAITNCMQLVHLQLMQQLASYVIFCHCTGIIFCEYIPIANKTLIIVPCQRNPCMLLAYSQLPLPCRLYHDQLMGVSILN